MIMLKLSALPFAFGVIALFLLLSPSVRAQSPTLAIDQVAGQQIKLSWPESAASYVLEHAPRFAAGATWTAVSAIPVTEGVRKTVTIAVVDSEQYFRLRGSAGPALTTIARTSPVNGEAGVSVNRETIVSFSKPLAAGTMVNADTFHTEFGSRRLLSRIELSSDRRRVTLFYLEPIPAGARVTVRLIGDSILDADGQAVDADGNGTPGGTAAIQFDTMTAAAIPGTAVIGHVYASDPVASGNGFTNRPLQNVLITVDGAEERLLVMTDASGFFRLEPCPAGRFFVHIDGRTASGSTWPDGAYYPFVGKTFEAIAGRTNTPASGSGDIFLPLIKAGTLQSVSASLPTTVTFPAAVLAQNPSLQGVSITVPANSLFGNDGTRGGRVGIAPVPPDRIPSPLPPGLDFPLVITIQTDGPANFDQPVPVQFPNLPDPITGKSLHPGEKTWLWSFNHDTGKWEPQGTMTISADGLYAVTDPGVGVRQPGWHGVNPGSPPEYPTEEHCPDYYFPSPGLLKEFLEQQLQEAKCAIKLASLFGVKVDLGWKLLTKSLSAAKTLAEEAVKASEYPSDSLTSDGYLTILKAIDAAKGVISTGVGDIGAESPVPKTLDFIQCLVKFMKETLDIGCRISDCIPRDSVSAQQLAVHDAVCNDLRSYLSAAEKRLSDLMNLANFGKLALDFDTICAALGLIDTVVPIVNSPAPASLPAKLSSAAPPPLSPDQIAFIMAQTAVIADSAKQLEAQFEIFPTIDAALEELLRKYEDSLQYFASPYLSKNHAYQNAYYRLAYGGLEFRGRSSSLGYFELPILAPETSYMFEIYDPFLSVIAITSGTSASRGQTTFIPDPLVKVPGLTDLSGDTDGDGLTDAAERIIGTRSDQKDTDGDGVADLEEIQQGQDPLSGLNLPVGIIASVPLTGEAYAVKHHQGHAYLATGRHGLAVVNIERIDAPVLVNQLDLTGLNFALTIAPAQNMIGVAAASETVFGPDFALHFVDIANPDTPRLVRSLSLPVVDIAEQDGLFYAALKQEVRIFDPTSGIELGWTPTANRVFGITMAEHRLYVATSAGLEIYQATLPTPLRLGRLDLDVSLVGRFNAEGDMLIQGNVLHAGTGNGYVTIDVSDPTKPKLLGKSSQAFPPILHSLDLNGSGLMFSLISFSASNRDLAAFDASDPAKVDTFLYSLDTLDVSRHLDLVSGVALVADFRSGLTIINTSSSDARGKAPQVSIDLSSWDTNPSLAGVQVLAGSVLSIQAQVADDVQLGEARLLLDGEIVASVEAGPIVFSLDLPGRIPANGRVNVQAQAVDTGGNTGNSAVVALEVVADTRPPVLVASVPSDGGGAFATGSLVFRFDEPLQSVSSESAAAMLLYLGADGRIGGGDDVAVPIGSIVTTGATLVVTPAASLASGQHRLELPEGLLSDRAGNKPASDLVMQFNALNAALGTAVWISTKDGRYSDPANWLYRRAPNDENVLLPTGLGQPIVTLTTPDTYAARFESHLPLRIESGAELEVRGDWIATSPLVISNGSVFVGVSATFHAPVEITGGELETYGAATFKSTLSINHGGKLRLNGTQAAASMESGFAAMNFTVVTENGASVSLPQFTRYQDMGDFTTFRAAGTAFQALGRGSRITLPELTSVEGPTNWNVRSIPAIQFLASGGGVIQLPKLATATGRTSMTANDPGSEVNAPNLASVTGPDSEFISAIDISNQGAVTLSANTSLTRCNVTLQTQGVLRGGSLEFAESSSLRGVGTVMASVLNRGTIHLDRVVGGLVPGGAILSGLIVGGDLDLTPSSVINTTLGLGATRDLAGQFEVRGDTTLAGTFRVTPARGYTPAAGQQFGVGLFAKPPTGAFAQLDDSSLGLTLKAALALSPQDLKVNIASRP